MSLLVFVGPNSTRDVAEYVSQHDEAILIEPLSYECCKLRRQFKDHPGVRVVQAACGKRNKRALFHKYNRGLSSSLSVVTVQARARFSHADFTPGKPAYVRVIHLGKWLKKQGITQVDTLIIDAQGHDAEILETVTDYLPTISVVMTEADNEGFKHYQGPENSVEAQKAILEPFGFVGTLNKASLSWHPDVIWTREDE